MNTFNRRNSSLAFALLLMLGTHAPLPAAPAAAVQDRIDWPAFMARHDLVWDKVPGLWHEGAFLGNGLLGTMIWAQPGETLHFDVGRSDVVDGGGRIAIGRFELVAGTVKTTEMRLDLWNAEARGAQQTAAGKLEWRAFTHAIKPLTIIELSGAPAKIVFRQEPALDARKVHKKEAISDSDRNPEPTTGSNAGVNWSVQTYRAGGGYVVAWGERSASASARRFAWTVEVIPAGSAADTVRDRALAEVQAALGARDSEYLDSHRAWWHEWWRKGGFLSVPDTRIESFYWIQMYKLASATRADRPAIDLMGPWFRTTPWPKIWWNLNIQLTYWPVYAANRLDLGESLVRMLDAGTSNLIANVPEPLRGDSAGIGRTSSYDCRGGAGKELGNLTWTLHNYWLQYRYSGDETLLRNRLYPLLRRAGMYMVHNLKPDADGRLHFPVDVSPEYPQTAPDTNYDLGLLRWALRVLLATNDRFNLRDPLAPQWRETLSKLVDFPYDPKTGYMIGAGVPLAQSHRHFSHLLSFFPLHVLDADDPAERARLEKSLDHWIGFEGALQGYSFTGASAMSAWLRRRDASVELLNQFLDRFVKANTMYLEAGPVIETPLAGAMSLHEILLQSATPEPFDTLIRVFPGVPATWPEVTIHRMAAEGGFVVSAARRNGRTQWIQITSLAGNPCRVETGMTEPVVAHGARAFTLTKGADKAGRQVTLVDLQKGETVLLTAGTAAEAALAVEPVQGQPDRRNFYGAPKVKAITPQVDGTLLLQAKDAILEGAGLMLERKAKAGNVGHWIQPGDYLHWNVQGLKAGTYTLSASYASTGSGKKLGIEIASGKGESRKIIASVAAPTRSSGGWDKFNQFELGTLQLSGGGAQSCEIIARGLDGQAPSINLEHLQLKLK